jgi:uncharacterized circularly permuted ATP-grasp superfamily protein
MAEKISKAPSQRLFALLICLIMDGHLLQTYRPQTMVWDEMFESSSVRPAYSNFFSAIEGISPEEMNRKDELAKKLFMSQGITFTVYSSGEGIEKIFPFDIIRIIRQEEWCQIEKGIKQRLKALNIFLKTYIISNSSLRIASSRPS